MTETYYYAWRNNAERERLYGRPCVVEARGSKNSVLVRFTDGRTPSKTCTSRYAIRKTPPKGAAHGPERATQDHDHPARLFSQANE